MKAWLIKEVGELSPEKFIFREIQDPEISSDEILIKVKACGICHTELDEIEGRAKPSILPVIPGHQIVGEVVAVGEGVKKFKVGDLAGAGWIYSTCGKCEFCKKGLENLCPEFKGTGKDAHGGYAEYFKIKEAYAFKLPYWKEPEKLAPFFCAGSIGYRALKISGIKNGEILGLIGFGASNHLVLKMAKALYPDSPLFVFARNPAQREMALKLGADFAFDIEEEPEDYPHALIDTTPVWKPPLYLLRYLRPGGRLVINAIRKEEHDKDFLLELSYERDLWLEKEIKTVANITRADIEEFLKLVEKAQIEPEVEIYSFDEVFKALEDLKNYKIRGAKVLKIG
ncbi:MAG: alcohol dehydrogenase catalytic domain-containing protein [Caldimicrobium sp.]